MSSWLLKKFLVTTCVASLVIACSGQTSPTAGEEATPVTQIELLKPMLPVYALPGERKGPGGKADQYDDYRAASPGTYAITAAPQTPLRAVAQWDDHQAMLITWTGAFPDVYAAMIAASKSEIDIYVVHDGNLAKQQFQSAMAQQGTSTTGLQYFNMANDSIWIRDYGPLSARAPDGTVAFVDPRYYHQRVFDDAIPSKIADIWDINTYRQPLQWEGGTYIADGLGNCIYTQGVYWYGGTSAEKIHGYQADYLGCKSNIVIKPLVGEGTTHSDMFAKMYAPGKILLGEYTGFQDGTNKATMDDDADILAGAVLHDGSSLQVTRIPMPSNSNKTVWRTYANSLFVNGVNLVPVYSDDTSKEAAAMGVWEDAMPGWDHVKIDSTELITWAGAIHCITMTVPTGPLEKVETDPDWLCSGDFDCFPTNTQGGSCANGYEGCCNDSTLQTCDADGATTGACGGQGCGWSDTTMSYRCGGSGAGPIANAPLTCGAECVPNCADKTCGADGCGGSCGTCGAGQTCLGGQCETPDDPCAGITWEGCCDGSTLKYCESGIKTVSCGNQPCGWQAGQGWYNCGFSGSDPSGAHPKACPSDCTPDCGGGGVGSEKVCGDDGCGGSCGTCAGGETCTGGQCVCAPGCASGAGPDKVCGDDGCGGSCGSCGGGQTCDGAGQCVDSCTPDCAGKACGADGCEGSCGTCASGTSCVEGQCEAPTDCGDVTFQGKCDGDTLVWCQNDELFTYDCKNLGAFECKSQPGSNPPDFDCLPMDGPCTPDCAGKSCGGDGCGGVCGSCEDGAGCIDGQCENPNPGGCDGLTWEGCCDGDVLNWCHGGQKQTVNCGDAGCGWSDSASYYDCGYEGEGPAEFPIDCGGNQCVPDCGAGGVGSDKVCGADGCGGSCGTCSGGSTCEAGQCVSVCGAVSWEGACNGTVLSYCTDGQLQSGDCAEFGGCCGFSAEAGYFDCLDGALCTDCLDGCAAGDKGCSTEGTHEWTCVTGANGCLAPAYASCDGAVCSTDAGACPDGPQPCEPDCTGKQCGGDGCGDSCGLCAAGESCNADGLCVAGCTPSCEGKLCGTDGCGGSCGDCLSGTSCVAGQCVETPCIPDCGGGEAGPVHECGDDGCGGSCGGCLSDKICDKTGTCVEPPEECTPDCAGGGAGPVHECGPDGCGNTCGVCGKEQNCTDGQCIDKPDAGCGGVPESGACAGDVLQICKNGTVSEINCATQDLVCGPKPGLGADCIDPDACLPNCVGKQCGSNGCGGACGICSKGDTCTGDGQCVSDTCVPACVGLSCGSDGCGGLCGTCATGQACNQGVCEAAELCPDGSSPVDGQCVDGGTGTGGTATEGEDDDPDEKTGDKGGGCVAAGSPGSTNTAGGTALGILFALGIAVLRRRESTHGQASA